MGFPLHVGHSMSCDVAVELSKTWGKALFWYSVSIAVLTRVVRSVPDTVQAMSRDQRRTLGDLLLAQQY